VQCKALGFQASERMLLIETITFYLLLLLKINTMNKLLNLCMHAVKVNRDAKLILKITNKLVAIKPKPIKAV
jgi:hypothetical protein